MRHLRAYSLLVLFCFALQAEEAPSPLTLHRRFRVYLEDTYSPLTLAGSGFSAAISHWSDEPPEWQQRAPGFARRYGSWFGQAAIKDTIEFGVAALDGEYPRYCASKRKGIWARSYDAMAQTIFPYKAKGGRMFAVSGVLGSFSSGLISNAWYPDSGNNWRDGLVRGAGLFGGDVASNLFHEFWPDIKSKVFRRKATAQPKGGT